jgi:DNA polymerase III subunit beta
MKNKNTIVLEQKPLVSILAAMQPICTKKTALDITSFILFDIGPKELVLKSTDLEISLQSSCLLLESDLTENKKLLVSGKRMFEIVKELDGHIKCSIEKSKLSLKSEGINLSLNIKEPEEFPPFPERIENILHIDAKLLLNLLENVSFLIPQHNVNPALNGLLLEINGKGLIMTSTDGHCLAQVRTPRTTIDQEYHWLLPRRAVFELKKILQSSPDNTVFIGICDSQLVFSGEVFNFFTKVLADKFPPYQSILDKTSFIPVKINKSKFIKALRRSACLLSGQFMATQFSFTPEKLHIALQNKEVGTLDETLEIEFINSKESQKYQKQEDARLDTRLDIRFYSPYLLNGLQALESTDAICYLKNSTAPIIFNTDEIDYNTTYLVMPVLQTNSLN